ncbi:DUF3159 domain-containing protein [Pseudonocardiaceae bacterium YIM PH 21723]|nr:DUF3159 domain-containing protein [Pseudonocardiaceae bacterium YIM PH 21723]
MSDFPASAPAALPDGKPSEQEREQTMLEQMGGVSGLIYSGVPVLVFVFVNLFAGMMPAIWAALGSAILILVLRIVRKEPVQPAISGFLGVGVCAFIAYYTGSAKGFFSFGIWLNLVYGGAFLLSALIGWPLVGVAWSALNGQGMEWRKHRAAVIAYYVATLTWAAIFAARYLAQKFFYDANDVSALGITKIAMSWPLTALGGLVSFWAIRRVRKVVPPAEEPAPAA